MAFVQKDRRGGHNNNNNNEEGNLRSVMNTAPGDLVEHWPLSRRKGEGVIMIIIIIIIIITIIIAILMSAFISIFPTQFKAPLGSKLRRLLPLGAT